MTVQPDTDELETRARLAELGVSYTPTVPGPARAGAPGEGGHLEHAAPAAEEERDVPAADTGQEPEPAGAESSARPGLRDRVRAWVEAVEERTGHAPPARTSGDTPEDAGDAGDTGDEEAEEDAGDTPEDTGEDTPVKRRPLPARLIRKTTGDTGDTARKARRPRGRPRFSAPGLPFTARPGQERRSLVDIIRSTPPHIRWLTYNGSALGAGFWLGWPQWVKDGAAFLATEHPTLTDTYSLTCYGLAVGVVALDYRARGWVLPLAWAFRVPTVSLAVGVPLYGVSIPISQLY